MALKKPEVAQEKDVAVNPAVEEARAAVQAAAPTAEPVEAAPTVEPESTAEEGTLVDDAPEAPAVQPTGLTEARSTGMAQGNQAGNLQQFLAQQDAQGFSGLTLDSFSFERIKLHEGQFILGEDEELGTTINFQPLACREIYVIRQSKDEDSEMFYSYDPEGRTHTDGSSAQATLNEWLEDGFGTDENPLVVKPYQEITATLVQEGGDHDGEIVNLSVPPSSRSRFGGQVYIATRKLGVSMDHVLMEAQVGSKVGSGNTAFRPWKFRALGIYQG